MKAKHIRLAREQLDQTLSRFAALRAVRVPPKGWIRAIRDALGITGGQLAKRLEVNSQRISRMEQDEVLGNVTLKTLRNAAKALDCTFVYGFVPNESLEQTVKNQAESVARKRMERSNQMMRLEQQELSETEKAKAIDDLILDIVETMPKSLWDEV